MDIHTGGQADRWTDSIYIYKVPVLMLNAPAKFHYDPIGRLKVILVTVGRTFRQMDGFNLYLEGVHTNVKHTCKISLRSNCPFKSYTGYTVGRTFRQTNIQTNGWIQFIFKRCPH
jgi:hypothetical protein